MLKATVRLMTPGTDTMGRTAQMWGSAETVYLIAAHSSAGAEADGDEWAGQDQVTIYAQKPLGGDRAKWEIPGYGVMAQTGPGDLFSPPWPSSLPVWRGKLVREVRYDRQA